MILKDPIAIIQKHWNQHPVPIEAIIADMEIPLEYQPLDDDISGWIERIGGQNYKIVVNSRHSETRRRFTAAHELGHYIYHRDLLGEGVADSKAYRAEGTIRPNGAIRQIHERQANSFAANVLMPKHALQDVANKSTAELARKFNVSPAAMRIRLGRPI